MDYGMIGQIAKAKLYAEERHRIRFISFVVTLQGSNNTHTVRYDNGQWACDASFFQQHGWSSHTVALERILKGMIDPVPVAPDKEPAPQSAVISQVEKAHKYTDEPSRVHFVSFTAEFTGDNHTHTVTYDNGAWNCTCNFFASHKWCSHVIAVERILGGMITPAQRVEVN